MNDDMLSQEEINELLKSVGGDDDDDMDTSNEEKTDGASGEAKKPGKDIADYLDPIEQDALGEIGNISFGSAATALSQLLGQKVEITTPVLSLIHYDELHVEFPHPHVAIHVEYTDGFEGMNLLVIHTKDAAIIADLMLGGDGENPDEEMDDMHISAVQEAMNQMMGSASTSMSSIFNKRVDISPPGIDLLDVKEAKGTSNLPDDEQMVQVSFHLKIGSLIDSSIMQLVTIPFAKKMVDELLHGAKDDHTSQVAENNTVPTKDQNLSQEPTPPEPAFEKPHRTAEERLQAGNQSPNSASSVSNSGNEGYPKKVQPASFSSFDSPTLNEAESKNLNMLLDIPLEVSVELGRTKRSIKEILEFSQGSIIELDKLAGEPVDILVNQKLIAKGEVVVIDENFGVRVTDIVSQADRIRHLK